MKQKKKTIRKRLSEKQNYINKQVGKAIINKQKTHFTAPTNTGKTYYIAGLIEALHEEYQFIVMEPLISITGQLSVLLDSRGVKNYFYNSETRRKLTAIEEKIGRDWPYTYLSTIDSAYRLFEEGKVNPDNTIVIIDESHSFLQSARSDFDRTVRAIKKSGCPVVGFTATQSSWVLEELFRFDKVINFNATDIPPKKIYPFQIKRGIPKSIAEIIRINNWKKVAVLAEIPDDHDRIEKAVQEANPTLKVTVLNKPRRDSTEKAAWDYMIKHEKFPPGTNVLIGNSVIQGGVNINDTDIDAQILAYQFDPLGFQQYLGRCRKYTGGYHYFFGDYGSRTISWVGPKEEVKFYESIYKVLDKYGDKVIQTLGEIDPVFYNLYTYIPEVGYVPNKCMIANMAYSCFRKLHGELLLQCLEQINPELVIDEIHEDPGYSNQSNAKTKAKDRKQKKDELLELLKKNAAYIAPMIETYNERWTHEAATSKVNASTSDKRIAKKNDKLYIPRTRKQKVLDTISTAKQAQVSIDKVIVAANKYLEKGKSEKVLKAILNMSGNKFKNIKGAYLFFEGGKADEPTIKSILDDALKHKTEIKSAADWEKEIIKGLPSLPGSSGVAKRIYDYCFMTSQSSEKVNGKTVYKQKLNSIVRHFPEYKKSKGLDDIL